MSIATSTITVTRAVILKPGESFTLPPGASLKGSDNVSSISSSCIDAVPQLNMKCWVVSWKQNEVGNTNGFLENAVFKSVQLDDTVYNINARTDGAQFLRTELETNTNVNKILIVKCASNEDLVHESSCFIKFTLPDIFKSAPLFVIKDFNSSGLASDVILKSYEGSDCTNCSSFPPNPNA